MGEVSMRTLVRHATESCRYWYESENIAGIVASESQARVV